MSSADLLYLWRVVTGQEQDHFIRIIILTTILTVTPVGYHIIVLNVPAKIIQETILIEMNTNIIELNQDILDFLWSFIVACQSLGAFISCFFVLPVTKRFGIKYSLMFLNNLFLIIGSIAFFLASIHINAILLLIIGRLLIGVYTGIGSALVPIYIQELAPAKIKGALSCFLHIAVCMGSALGAFFSLDNFLGRSTTWNYLLALPIVFGLIQMVFGAKLPHLPGYFMEKNNRKKAAESIRFYYMLDNMDDEKAIATYHSMVSELPSQISFNEAIEKPDVLNGIWLGIMVSMAQIFSGGMATVSYSTSMFDSVLDASWIAWLPTLGALMSIILTLPALKLVETCSRKQLFISTLAICAISNALLALITILSPSSNGVITSLLICLTFFIFGVGYNIGVGPMGYFLPSELVCSEAVGVAMGCAVAINWLTTMITTLIYYPLNKKCNGWSYFFFVIPTTFFTWYLRRKLPNNSNNDDNCNLSQLFSNSFNWIKRSCIAKFSNDDHSNIAVVVGDSSTNGYNTFKDASGPT